MRKRGAIPYDDFLTTFGKSKIFAQSVLEFCNINTSHGATSVMAIIAIIAAVENRIIY